MACQCGKCRLRDANVLPYHTRLQEQDALSEPVLLGLFTMTEWKTHEALYLFSCRACRKLSISFPCFRGIEGLLGALHLHCTRCLQLPNIVVSQQVYYELGVPFPDPGEIIAALTLVQDLGSAVCLTAADLHP